MVEQKKQLPFWCVLSKTICYIFTFYCPSFSSFPIFITQSTKGIVLVIIPHFHLNPLPPLLPPPGYLSALA